MGLTDDLPDQIGTDVFVLRRHFDGIGRRSELKGWCSRRGCRDRTSAKFASVGRAALREVPLEIPRPFGAGALDFGETATSTHRLPAHQLLPRHTSNTTIIGEMAWLQLSEETKVRVERPRLQLSTH